MGFTNNETINKINVVRATKFENDGKLTVFFDMTVNGVTIYGCRFLTGSKGDFVAFPQRKGGDKYYNVAWVKLSDADVNTIEAQIRSALEVQ